MINSKQQDAPVRPDQKKFFRKGLDKAKSAGLRIALIAEAVRANGPLVGAAGVVAVTTVTVATCLSWQSVAKVVQTSGPDNPVAMLVPLGVAILVLTATHVTWSLTVWVNEHKRAKTADERMTRLEADVDLAAEKALSTHSEIAAMRGDIGRIADNLEKMKANLADTDLFKSAADKPDIWEGYVQSYITDGSRQDKEVILRARADGGYDAMVLNERVGTYVVDRLVAGSGLTSWTATFYWPESEGLGFDRLAREPAIRFMAMIEGAIEIGQQRGLTLDVDKLEIVLCKGPKPDLASFLAFRQRSDGLFERILIEYARPIDPNRALKAADRVTIVRCPQAIAEREQEVMMSVSKGRSVSIAEMRELVRPYLRQVCVLDPANLPGVAFGDHLQFEDRTNTPLDDGPSSGVASSDKDAEGDRQAM